MTATLTKRAVLSMETLLSDGIEALGLTLDAAQRQQLLDFLALLAKWNAVYNLTAVRDVQDMLVVHLLDALSILPLLEAYVTRSLVDVGSGAGIPAIPLAIARPSLEVHSIDSVAKKIGFQLQARTALQLRNLHPVHARIEHFALPEPASVIVSRAYTDLASMLASVEHLASADTTIVAMKGVVPDAEIALLPAAWTVARVVKIDVPFLGAARCAVVLKRGASRLS